jgi:endonuclease-3
MAAQLAYRTISEIFRRFEAAAPEPRGELDYVSPYTLLVAVALSAQATDKGVNRATEALFRVADTPAKMLALGEEGLVEHIRSIGLYRAKARHVMALSRILARSSAARCRPRARRSRACPASGARPRTWC